MMFAGNTESRLQVMPTLHGFSISTPQAGRQHKRGLLSTSERKQMKDTAIDKMELALRLLNAIKTDEIETMAEQMGWLDAMTNIKRALANTTKEE